MNRKQTLVGLILSTAPLLVLAQNTNTPGGQASTGTPLEQTKTSSQKPAFNKSTKTTTPDATSSGAMSSGTTGTMSKKPRTKTTNATPTGDVPTYPAPAPDGTPTK